VIHGDTGIVQYGIGTFGSRATAVGGTAVFIAIQKLKDKANKIAAHILKSNEASLSFSGGRFSRGTPATEESSEPVVPVGEAPAGALPEPDTEGKSSLTIQE